MRVYLIRHGSTAGNLEKRYVGTTDEPLTPEAVCELKKMRENSRQYRGDPENGSLMVFASPLRRCLMTAQLLFPNIEPRVEDDLRECSFGEFEYKNYKELSGDARYQAWIDSGGETAFPNGESREQFAKRCRKAFVKACGIAERSGCAEAAFVVHGGTIMAVMEQFAVPRKGYFEWQVKNAEGFFGELCRTTDEAGRERIVIQNVRRIAETKKQRKSSDRRICSDSSEG